MASDPTRIASPRRPPTVELFVGPAMPCPYLDGRMERKLVAELARPDADLVYNVLSLAGFRRSHTIAYTTACEDCEACIPVRVRADRFRPSRNLRRVAAINAEMSAVDLPAQATDEQYALFSRYVRSRHGDGNMAEMTFEDYRLLVEETPVRTLLVEFRDPDRSLVGACLVDLVDDGLSAVYSFFDPDLGRRSLGTAMILWLLGKARARGLPHVYLGFWVKGSRKMDYKSRFTPLEAHVGGRWVPFADTPSPSRHLD